MAILSDDHDYKKLADMTVAGLEMELRSVNSAIFECETDPNKMRLRRYYAWMRDRIQKEINSRDTGRQE